MIPSITGVVIVGSDIMYIVKKVISSYHFMRILVLFSGFHNYFYCITSELSTFNNYELQYSLDCCYFTQEYP